MGQTPPVVRRNARTTWTRPALAPGRGNETGPNPVAAHPGVGALAQQAGPMPNGDPPMLMLWGEEEDARSR